MFNLCCHTVAKPDFRKANRSASRLIFRLEHSILQAIVVLVSILGCQIASGERPNIVLISMDDADRDMFKPEIMAKRFPRINEIARQGITFTNFHVASPLCGPSRACLLRGQYAHALSHRVNRTLSDEVTRGFVGDYDSFMNQGFSEDDIGKWMQDAGYHTIFVGKYLNGLADKQPPIHQGWNDFYGAFGSAYYKTHRFTNRYRAEGSFEKLGETQYRTHVEGIDVARSIRKQSGDNPFFIYFAPLGPHTEGAAAGGMIDTRFKDTWPYLKFEPPFSFNEEDTGDKHPLIAALPPINQEKIEGFATMYRERMLSIRSVDIAVGRIQKALADVGQLDNTIFIITSDNGFLMGQHRLVAKGVPYSEAINVPLMIKGPNIPQGITADHLLSSVDIAPTLLSLAETESKPFFDGKSFAPLLTDPLGVDAKDWQDSILVENWQTKRMFGQPINATFIQLRMPFAVFTEWSDGHFEYFDLINDPHELENKIDELSPEIIEGFRQKIKKLRRPMPAPLITYEDPKTNYAALTGPPFLFEGVSEESVGIKSVVIVIQDIKSRAFWNGDGWQKDRFLLKAELKNPGGVLSDWSYSFDPGEHSSTTDSFAVRARTFAEDLRYTDPPITRLVRHDSLPPVSRIVSIESNPLNQMMVVGEVSDNRDVLRVGIQVTDGTGSYLQADETWSEQPHQFFVLPSDGKWQWKSSTLPAGDYKIVATAQDLARNWEISPLVSPFKIEAGEIAK